MGRLSLHQNITPAAVRDKLRAECLQRVQEQRSALLWRLRNAHADGQSAQDILESVIDDVVGGVDILATPRDAAATSCHATSSGPREVGSPASNPQIAFHGTTPSAATPNGWTARASVGEENGIKYDVQHQTPVHFGKTALDTINEGSSVKRGGRTRLRFHMGNEPEYCPTEDIELLLMMERALYEDVLQVQAEAAAAEESAAVDAIIDTHLSSSGPFQGSEHSGLIVPCPVCLHANLGEHCGVIACPNGDLMLDLRAEGLTLEHLRGRLADAFASHGDSGCGATPAFAPQVFERGGPATLLMSCAACGALQVVV
eukprot:jgi/Botrbrau1/18148/Bobra.53_1s0019.1